jgi:hypothetical protein
MYHTQHNNHNNKKKEMLGFIAFYLFIHLSSYLFISFWDRILLGRPGYSQTCHPLVWSPKCWGYRYTPLCSACWFFILQVYWNHLLLLIVSWWDIRVFYI